MDCSGCADRVLGKEEGLVLDFLSHAYLFIGFMVWKRLETTALTKYHFNPIIMRTGAWLSLTNKNGLLLKFCVSSSSWFRPLDFLCCYFRSGGSLVVMEHETSLNFHLQFLHVFHQDSTMHNDYILPIMFVNFTVSCILADCILQKQPHFKNYFLSKVSQFIVQNGQERNLTYSGMLYKLLDQRLKKEQQTHSKQNWQVSYLWATYWAPIEPPLPQEKYPLIGWFVF